LAAWFSAIFKNSPATTTADGFCRARRISISGSSTRRLWIGGPHLGRNRCIGIQTAGGNTDLRQVDGDFSFRVRNPRPGRSIDCCISVTPSRFPAFLQTMSRPEKVSVRRGVRVDLWSNGFSCFGPAHHPVTKALAARKSRRKISGPASRVAVLKCPERTTWFWW